MLIKKLVNKVCSVIVLYYSSIRTTINKLLMVKDLLLPIIFKKFKTEWDEIRQISLNGKT